MLNSCRLNEEPWLWTVLGIIVLRTIHFWELALISLGLCLSLVSTEAMIKLEHHLGFDHR